VIAVAVLFLLAGTLEDAGALEQQGALWQAGALYEQARCPSGEARVLCSLLEEALYAGHTGRASMLIRDLMEIIPDSCTGELDYWYARLAWGAGLDSLAIATLDGTAGDPWLVHRSRGTALLYSGRPFDAAVEFRAAVEEASTARRAFYAALDLGFSLISCGMYDDASRVIRFLSAAYPSEALPRVQEAILLWRTGMGGRAASLLDSLASSRTASVAIRDMSSRLLERVE